MRRLLGVLCYVTMVLLGLFSGIGVCQVTFATQNGQLQTDSQRRGISNMRTILEQSLNGNLAILSSAVKNKTGVMADSPSFKRFGMTRSTWSLHKDNHNGSNDTDTGNSVPIVTSNVRYNKNISNYNPLKLINSVTGSAAILKKIQTGYAKMKQSVSLKSILARDIKSVSHKSNSIGKPVRTLENSFGKPVRTLDSRYGVYIPMEKLHRVRRQAMGPANDANQKGRILILMNPNVPVNETFDKTKLNRSVLMLVKKSKHNNTISENPDVISLKNHSNIREILKNYMVKPDLQSKELREVLERKPAIQRIKDLNNIELALPVESQKKNGSSDSLTAGKQIETTNDQIRRLLEILIEETRRNRVQNTPAISSTSGSNMPRPQRPTTNPRLQVQQARARLNATADGSNRQAAVRNNLATARRQSIRRTGVQGTPQPSRAPQGSSRPVVQGHTQTRRQVTKRLGQGRSRGTQGRSHRGQAGGRSPVATQPQLTRQNPVSRGRISPTSASRVIATARAVNARANRPLVRAISSQNLHQSGRRLAVTRGRGSSTPQRGATPQRGTSARVGTPQRSGVTRSGSAQRGATSHRGAVQQRVLNPRRGGITQRRPTPQRGSIQTRQRVQVATRRRAPTRTPVRRQFVRRRRPSDPFTRRFSAGFQRGSSLLDQPPLNNTGFDGGSGPGGFGGGPPGGIGFNTLNFGPTPPFGSPPGLPGISPMFGGAGMPNMFLGPTIL